METLKTIDELIVKIQNEMPYLTEKFKVQSLGVFGSRVRHQNHPDSDLDILVSFVESPSLFQFIEMENFLTDLLGIKVDLVVRQSLRRRIGEHILAEVVSI
jgi:uncharacterized protein